MQRKSPQFGFWLLLLIFAAPDTYAERRAGDVELILFGGSNGNFFSISDPVVSGLRLAGIRDITVNEGTKVKWLAGTGVGASLHKHVVLVGEFAFNHLGNSTYGVRAPGSTRQAEFGLEARLYEFTVGTHFLLPAGQSMVFPYLGMGVGGSHFRLRARASPVTFPGAPTEASSTDLAGYGSFGLRLDLSERWGIRPEIRVVRIPDDTYYRASLGVFFRFR
ncbi:MAG: outer membrane beta-barrel protein [Acidobacteria bacterium]|nr:outer membrane beta-barrel protein [Acidobacteriota bacterium]MCI0724571.1 outer membrane beta-barrel protein [Acidobacteriota bacterium]